VEGHHADPDGQVGCPVCGQRLARHGPCPNRWCGRADRWFSVVFAAGVHHGALRHAIGRYKYNGERWWAATFASVLAGYVASRPTWFEEFDLLAAVPAYRGPGSRRAWDPVGEILAAVAADPGRWVGWEIAPQAVVKTVETPPMRGRSWPERQVVAQGPLRAALQVPDPPQVAGARVLVLDDVMAEGGTMREVARALRLAGAAEAAGLVLARPPWTARGS
jgi:predicted amidophosphoribosyltransferase